MRKLAVAAASFSAAVFAAVLIGGDGWQLWAAGIALLLFAAAYLCRKRLKHGRYLLLILPLLAAGLLYCAAYRAVLVRPILALCGDEPHAFAGTVCDWPRETDYGAKVTVRLTNGWGAKAVYYGDESLLSLAPGNRIAGTARWQNAGHIRENDIATFTGRGIYALLYEKGEVTVEEGSAGSIRWIPQRMAKALAEKVREIWTDERTAGFVLGELTGDTSGIAPEDYAAVRGAGLAHLFAVSGLHCVYLANLVSLLAPKHRRRLACGITVGVLLVYMLMVGMTPSIVRACLMQILLLAAPLVGRDRDSVTDLMLALGLILLCNPYAAGSVSLQLSFGATLGLVLLSPRLQDFLTRWYRGRKRWPRKIISFTAANITAALCVMVFTLPLTAYYFHSVILVSPVSGLVALPAACWNFTVAFLTVLLGFVWLPAASAVGWISFALIRYVLWIARLLTRLPWSAVYFANAALWVWLALSYVLFAIAALVPGEKKRKHLRYLLATLLSVLVLVSALKVGAQYVKYGNMAVTAVDVGQGECILLTSDGAAAMVDCGSSGHEDAAACAAETLNDMKLKHLDALILTHYHADHAGGVAELMTQVKIGTLYLPDVEDEYGVRDNLVSLAKAQGIAVRFVEKNTSIPLGEATVKVFPPVGKGDINEQGLSVLCSAGDFDTLITGDMAAATERALMEKEKLPDIEVLVVSHHGSKYSSDGAFLQKVKPETAIISVGQNSYGHPAEETLTRLRNVGAAVYRTDRNGNVLVTVYGGT